MNWNQFQAAAKRSFNNEQDTDAKIAHQFLLKVEKTTSMTQKQVIGAAYSLHTPTKNINMKKNTFPPIPEDPFHRDDQKGAACRMAVANGELSLHPDAVNWIGNYIFYGVEDGQPVYTAKVDPDPNNNKGEEAHYKALDRQLMATGRIY